MIELRYSWRSRARQAAGAFVTFAGGVVAATAGAAVIPRVVGGLIFLIGAYWVLDALVLGASWRLAGDRLKIPTVVSRRREISGGNDLVVTAAGRWVAAIAITGEQGTRYLNVNPLVSPTDVRAWFADIADDQPEL